MANEDKVKQLAALLAGKGFSNSDVVKALKQLRTSGEIKSAGRGKSAEMTPEKTAIAGLLLKNGVMDIVGKSIGDSKSYMVSLNKDWAVNFVRKLSRPKKAKIADPSKAEKTKEGFAEPAIA